MSSASTTRPYDWKESDWFEDQDLPGYSDDTDHDATEETDSEYRDAGQGDEWGRHHSFVDNNDKYESLAHRFMRRVGRLLCATTLLDPPDRGLGEWGDAYAYVMFGEEIEHDPNALHTENREVELTDPEVFVPKEMPAQWRHVDYGQYRHRRRINEETGYVTGGESTAVYLADLPEELFMDAVDLYLLSQNFPTTREEELRGYARSLKREGQLRDTDILERVIYAADNGDDDT